MPLRLVPTRANRQPAFGGYLPVPATEIARPYGLFVLTLEGNRDIRDHVVRRQQRVPALRTAADAPIGTAERIPFQTEATTEQIASVVDERHRRDSVPRSRRRGHSALGGREPGSSGWPADGVPGC